LGLDIDPTFIALAQQTYRSRHFPNLSFLQKDAITIDFIAAFDVITCFGSIHCICDQKSLLSKLHAALKTQGKLLFMFVIEDENPNNFLANLKGLLQQPKWRYLKQ
jgi:SAM-dependent methyltransferase